MSPIDIMTIKEEAHSIVVKTLANRAKDALVKQMQAVENAKLILRGEEMKLADLERQIEDGTF